MNRTVSRPVPRRRRVEPGRQHRLLALALIAGTVPLGALNASPAQAAVSNPPGNNRSIIVFPQRDFINGGGYAASDVLTVSVVRNGVLLATSEPITPLDDPTTVGFDGFFDLNHAGTLAGRGSRLT